VLLKLLDLDEVRLLHFFVIGLHFLLDFFLFVL
jgi:hypothetical protein